MKVKTFFVILVTVLITIILMKNSEEVEFWFFGLVKMPKLAMLGGMLIIGFIIGLLVARPKRRKVIINDHSTGPEDEPDSNRQGGLSEEDREYIS